jgi:hypothetical protein
MAVNHRLHFGIVFIDRQVKEDLAGTLACSAKLFSFVIDLAQVFGLEKALGNHRRRTQDFAVVETNGDIAVIGRGEALGIDAPADLANLFLEFVLVHGDSQSFSRGSKHRVNRFRGSVGQ